MIANILGRILIAIGFLFISEALVVGQEQQREYRTKPVVGLVDEVEELFPDTKLAQPVKRLSVHTARNTVAGASVMVTGLEGTETIRFLESGENGKPTPGVRWYRMIDVPVAENTGLDRNTEKYSGKTNPYVIRRAPFRIYDPFRPVTSPIKADSTSLALRLEIPIDSTMPSGEYTHRLRIEICDQVEDL